MLHGHLAQVGELVSAVGWRLRLAVEELRAAAEGRRGRRPAGRSATWLAVVAHDALYCARSTVTILCLQQAAGQYPGAIGLTECWRGGQELGGRGAGAEIARPPGQPGLYAVRSSIAVAELLPALSLGVQVCVELVGRGEGGQGGGREGLGAGPGDGVSADILVRVLDCAMSCAVLALWCTSLVLAKHAEAIVGARQRQQQQQSVGAGGAVGHGCGGNEGGYVGNDGHGNSDDVRGDGVGEGGGDGGTPWRQLLLRDVRLMELLGAALELLAWAAAAAAAGPCGACEAQAELGALNRILARVLCQAACAFPADLCSAVGHEGGDAARLEAQTAAAAAAGQGTGAQLHGGSPACMPMAALGPVAKTDHDQATGWATGRHVGGGRPGLTLAAIDAVLSAGDHQDARRLLARVLAGDAAPASIGMEWGVPDAYLGCVMSKERAQDALRTLLLPAEARAAVAAAQGAAAPAAGP